MNSSNIKGALLEYTIRLILTNCGFTNVKADGIYTYENGGLFYINGKGAAHDADILVQPPIQMPFTYPTRLVFECKAYQNTISLAIVRNALGLRNDINDFEIVDKESLEKRKNNKRADYAIEKRNRFVFQVGVASINDYSKSAYEFAANNKIPLFSLSWFLDKKLISKYNSIDDEYIMTQDELKIKNLYKFLKDRKGDINSPEYNLAQEFLNTDNVIGDIVSFTNSLISLVFVGVLETGDLVFLYPSTPNGARIFREISQFTGLIAEIHYYEGNENVWRILVHSRNNLAQSVEFQFFIPRSIFIYWQKYNLDKRKALNIKQRFFSKIFVFTNDLNNDLPFSVIELNQDWIENLIYED